MADRTPGDDAAEWAGRLLVTLQFGLLALMGWGAWVTLPALELPAGALLFGSAGMALWTLAVNRSGNSNIRPKPRVGGALVTSSPYRWIRHPTYTSVLLAAAAAAVMSNHGFDAVLWVRLLTVRVVKSGIEDACTDRPLPQLSRLQDPNYKVRALADLKRAALPLRKPVKRVSLHQVRAVRPHSDRSPLIDLPPAVPSQGADETTSMCRRRAARHQRRLLAGS